MFSKELLDRAKIALTTTTVDYATAIVLSGRGEGAWVWDVDGKKYLDCAAGIGVNSLGYKHPAVMNAIQNQIIAGVIQWDSNVYPNVFQVELAEQLVSLSPGSFQKKVFFCMSGTEAVEAAVKLCISWRPQRKWFVAFDFGFHGRTLGALPLMGSGEARIAKFPMAYPVMHFPFLAHKNSVRIIHNALRRGVPPPSAVHAVILELVQGEGGVNIANRKAVKELVQLCKEYEIFVIVDEVQTGFGRTGTFFACEQYGIEPDIITLAKAVGGGMPGGAVIHNANINFQEGEHSNTGGGYNLFCAASLAVIGVTKQGEFLREVRRKGKMLLHKLILVQRQFPTIVKKARGLGLMAGVEFSSKALRDQAYSQCLKQGLLLAKAGHPEINPTLRFLPPLVISEDEISLAVSLFEDVVSKANIN